MREKDQLQTAVERINEENEFAAGIEDLVLEQAADRAANPGRPVAYERPVVDQVSEMVAFRSMAAGYEAFIADVDKRNKLIDEEVKKLHARAVELLGTKKANLAVRASKVTKLAGVRQTIRQIEDADCARLRAAEDAEAAKARQDEDRNIQ
jgi:hypothetical protein